MADEKQTKYIFGIDLGTTYSVISYLDDNMMIQTCSNQEGSDITPSVVDLSDPENPVVGQVAKDNKTFYPHSVLDFFKREMEKGDGVIFYGESGEHQTTPIQLSAEVLKYLARYAEDATDSAVKAVVITVPAYFGVEQKEATKKAAQLAGFTEVTLLEEPPAAAVYYGYKGDKNETVLVYDLGGGTFDIVAVDIDGFKYDCFDVEGDYQLGGKDWDTEMVKIIKEKLEEQDCDCCGLSPEDEAEVRRAAEDLKIKLTAQESAQANLRLEVGKAKIEVTRQEFEDRTRPLLDKTIELTKKVAEDASAKGKTITKILLVGGSSYMPQVQQRLTEEFPNIEVPNPMDPNKAVSKGAAYFGKTLLSKWIAWRKEIEDRAKEAGKSVEEIMPEDVSNDTFTLTTEELFTLTDGKTVAEEEVIDIKKVSVSSIGIKGLVGGKPMILTFLRAGDTLPVSKDQEIPLSDTALQSGYVSLSLYEHRLPDQLVSPEDTSAGLKEMQEKSGDITPNLPAGSKMHVHLEIDEEGLLKLTATDPNGKTVELEATAEAKSAN